MTRDDAILIGYVAFCAGLIVGAEIVRRQHRPNLPVFDQADWEARDKEWQAEQKEREVKWIADIADAVAERVGK